jgi:FkbM family methyltransferase
VDKFSTKWCFSKDYSKKIHFSGYTVKMDTLDNIMRYYNLKKVDLVKIDVEGAELDVLEGSFSMLKRYKPKLLIEVHFGMQWKPETLYTLLKNPWI